MTSAPDPLAEIDPQKQLRRMMTVARQNWFTVFTFVTLGLLVGVGLFNFWPKEYSLMSQMPRAPLGLAGEGHRPTAWQTAETFPFNGARRRTSGGQSSCRAGEPVHLWFRATECSSRLKLKTVARNHC